MFLTTRKTLKGFTLIELLIVIAIIGILAAAVLVAVNPAKRQNQAKDAQVKSDIGSIATAMQAYFTTPGAGSYPDNGAGEGLAILVANGDLKQVPTPPAGSSASYQYGVFPTATCDLDAVPAVLCTEAYVYATLLDPAAAGNVWCYETIEGKAEEETVVQCTDNDAAT